MVAWQRGGWRGSGTAEAAAAIQWRHGSCTCMGSAGWAVYFEFPLATNMAGLLIDLGCCLGRRDQ